LFGRSVQYIKNHVPEDGHNWRSKHVAGHAVCNTVNLDTRISIFCFFFSY